MLPGDFRRLGDLTHRLLVPALYNLEVSGYCRTRLP